MKLSELKALGEKASKGPWGAHNANPLRSWLVYPNETRFVLDPPENKPQRYPLKDTEDNATLIAAMRNHWDAMLKVLDKAQIALVVSSTSNMLAIKEALTELEAVK